MKTESNSLPARVFLVFLVLLMSAPAWAAEEVLTIYFAGTLNTVDGAEVVDGVKKSHLDGLSIAALLILCLSWGGQQVAITDANGAFSFNLLPPGQYTVRAELPGFIPAELEARVALDRATTAR